MNGIFNTEIKKYKERKQNVQNNIDDVKVKKTFIEDVQQGKSAEETYTGRYLERLGTYLLKSGDVDSIRRGKYTFFYDEEYYKDKNKTGKHTTPNTELIEQEDGTELKTLTQTDTEQVYLNKEYIQRLFKIGNLTELDLRNFILNWGNYTQIDLEELYEAVTWLKMEIMDNCTQQDIEMLNLFDGKRNITEVARILNVSKQNVSKKIKKICKKVMKTVDK